MRRSINLPMKLVAISLMLIAFYSMLFLLIFLKVEDKYISLINLYDFNVVVKARNYELTLQPFDTAEVVINTRNPIRVEVYNLKNELVDAIQVTGLKTQSQAVLVTLTPKLEYCNFSTFIDIDENGTYTPRDLKILNEEPAKFSVVDTDPVNFKYWYPGRQLSTDKMSFTPNTKYILPLNCHHKDNMEKIISNVIAFQTYNSEEQRKYYHEIQEKISSSVNLDEISNAVPPYTEKYFITDNEYVFIYE